MAEYEVLANPPVEEAIITVRLSRLLPSQPLEALYNAVSVAYPIVERVAGDGVERPATDPSQAVGGFRLFSHDRQQVIQVNPQAFSFHRLRPYDRWQSFVQAAYAAWRAFLPIAGPLVINEVQLRFVNVFHLPMPFQSWSEYLAMRPEVPRPVDTGLVSYTMSLNLTDPNVPAAGLVTQTTQTVSTDIVQVVFDIVTRTAFVGNITEEQLWRTIESLREYKNRLFFEGITERAKELFR